MGAASMKKKITVNVIIHMVLIILAVICLFPIFLVLINSFKENAEIVSNPLSLPDIIHLENFKFTQKNIINTTSFKIPYAAFQTEVVNVPMYGRIKGIIGASNSLKDANLVFIAYNDSQKYSNILTNEFFKSIGTKIAK